MYKICNNFCKAYVCKSKIDVTQYYIKNVKQLLYKESKRCLPEGTMGIVNLYFPRYGLINNRLARAVHPNAHL